MIILTKDQILRMHDQIVDRFGGEKGIREEGLFDSAVMTPFQTFDGQELYPTIEEKAARLGYSLIKNHCMVDGNKRIGTHSMLVLLALNGIELKYTPEGFVLGLCVTLFALAIFIGLLILYPKREKMFAKAKTKKAPSDGAAASEKESLSPEAEEASASE